RQKDHDRAPGDEARRSTRGHGIVTSGRPRKPGARSPSGRHSRAAAAEAGVTLAAPMAAAERQRQATEKATARQRAQNERMDQEHAVMAPALTRRCREMGLDPAKREHMQTVRSQIYGTEIGRQLLRADLSEDEAVELWHTAMGMERVLRMAQWATGAPAPYPKNAAIAVMPQPVESADADDRPEVPLSDEERTHVARDQYSDLMTSLAGVSRQNWLDVQSVIIEGTSPPCMGTVVRVLRQVTEYQKRARRPSQGRQVR
ncbi:MAG: hypothetical protein AAFQ51_12230, partial [Pseudomonadota bacterium]